MGRKGGGGAGVGEVDPSRLREEKDGMSGLPTDITRRLPEAGGGEGRMWRGRGGSSSGTLWLPQGGQLPAGSGGPSLVHHGDDGVAQVSRELKENQ